MNLFPKQKIWLTGGVLAFFLLIYGIVMPFMHKRQALKITKTVLSLWRSNDLPKSFDYWFDPSISPPVYGVLSYTITKTSFFDKDGQKQAVITVRLTLTADNTMPSDKEWNFTLTHDAKLGWKIKKFEQSY